MRKLQSVGKEDFTTYLFNIIVDEWEVEQQVI